MGRKRDVYRRRRALRRRATAYRYQFGDAAFIDGNATAENAAPDLKRNLEMPTDSNRQELGNIVLAAMRRNAEIQYSLFPYKYSFPKFSKYEAGMYYDTHTDAALMNTGDPTPMRTDFSCTIFLCDPASYEGGELTLFTESGPSRAKLAAGGAVFYPTGELHQVETVTRGQRLAAVLWMQSQIRDDTQRRILGKLSRLCDNLNQNGATEDDKNLAASAANSLLRLWSEV